MPLKPTVIVFAWALLPGALLAQARSPFLPPSGAAGGAAAGGPPQAYELAGASTSSEGTQICLYDTVHHRSHWFAVGKADSGIEVQSYDRTNDQAVVRFDGQVHVISLRKVKMLAGQVATFEPFTPSAGSRQNGAEAGPPVVDPSTIGKAPEVVKQEREARMLVSDLLEISIAQRKAYEEARAKAEKK